MIEMDQVQYMSLEKAAKVYDKLVKVISIRARCLEAILMEFNWKPPTRVEFNWKPPTRVDNGISFAEFLMLYNIQLQSDDSDSLGSNVKVVAK